jgi:Rrf2 family transcriptional regulator, nitric oxide-sensitive transcriptional repressor
MRLTRESGIAFALLVACARAPDQCLQTHAASHGTGASRLHAAKIASGLVHGGFLRALRGRSGGIVLARPAATISLTSVLRFTQPELAVVGRIDKAKANTALETIVDTALSTALHILDKFSIADLAAESSLKLACRGCHIMPSRCPDAASGCPLAQI